MILKCNMCGGDILVIDHKTYGICDSCGSATTFPNIDDEKIAVYYNRANHYRHLGEFDIAMNLYKDIINIDSSQAEAYWGTLLCRYGIEYVVDPSNKSRVPTCHRISSDLILDDMDYQSALSYTDDEETRTLYINEANYIQNMQREILALSREEEDYDIFICYKESDNHGDRTADSVLAQEIYEEFSKNGYKVFFSRITLEKYLGQLYEPAIFRGLQSSRVMIVVGTKPEYWNAPWVKNEWVRFLKMIKGDSNRLIIPCYRDMSPYDLPEELALIQSLDINKVGFIQDLKYGAEKIFSKKITANTPESARPTVESLIKRMEQFLEFDEWDEAYEYADRILDIDLNHSDAHIGKLCAISKVKKLHLLNEVTIDFSETPEYLCAIKYGNPADVILIENCLYEVRKKISEQMFIDVSRKVQMFLNSTDRIVIQNTDKFVDNLVKNYDYEEVPQWIEQCKQRLTLAKSRVRGRNILFLVGGLVGLVLIYIMFNSKYLINNYIIYPKEYSKGIELLEAGDFRMSRKIFADLDDYKDSKMMEQEVYYQMAQEFVQNGEYEEALDIYQIIQFYKDSEIKEAEMQLKIADEHLESGDWEASMAIIQKMKSSGDTEREIFDMQFEFAKKSLDKGNVYQAISILQDLDDNDYKPDELRQLLADTGNAVLSGKKSYKNNIAVMMPILSMAYEQEGMTALMRSMLATSLDMGDQHIVGVKAGGTVVTNGINDKGEGDVSGWRGIVSVAAGPQHTVGLMGDGNVVATGANYDGRCDVSDWSNVIQIAAGNEHTAALLSNGRVLETGRTWGSSSTESWEHMIQIDANMDYTIGLKYDGTVLITDNRLADEVGTWTDIVSVSAGCGHVLGVKMDGSIVSAGDNSYGERYIGDLPSKDVRKVAAGGAHSVALTEDGKVYAVGSDDDGRIDVSRWENIRDIVAGKSHTLGVTQDGKILLAGSPEYWLYEMISQREVYGKYNFSEFYPLAHDLKLRGGNDGKEDWIVYN